MRKVLLIATTNSGKLREMSSLLGDIEIECVSLRDIYAFSGPNGIPEAPEDFDTFEENAVSKAKFYGEKSGLLTVAEDSGLVIPSLDGWPGVKSARIKPDDRSRIEEVLRRMKGKIGEERDAAFVSVAALYNPENSETKTFMGICQGSILESPVGEDGFGYDPIFYHPDYGKSFAECTKDEKNLVSHRGQSFRALASFLATDMNKY